MGLASPTTSKLVKEETMTGNARRRLEGLEARARNTRPRTGSPDARRRMKARLDRIAELRRGGATVENNAELAATSEAVERRRRELRGGGDKL